MEGVGKRGRKEWGCDVQLLFAKMRGKVRV